MSSRVLKPQPRAVNAAFALVVLSAAGTAGTASAVTPGSSVPLGASNYWNRFVDFWLGGLMEQNGVVLFVLGAGLLSLFIITRGKWIK